jgi:hypothetical protein
VKGSIVNVEVLSAFDVEGGELSTLSILDAHDHSIEHKASRKRESACGSEKD